VALGHILVCGAIFRSGLMLKGTDDEQKEVLNVLLSASKKKSYLGTVTYIILIDFVNGVSFCQNSKYRLFFNNFDTMKNNQLFSTLTDIV
jgi:hypothetical protein